MEEKKKAISPILIVILTIIGICLVGFCVWYGVNYFKGEKENSEQGNTNTAPVEEIVDYSKFANRYIVFSSKTSKFNYKKLNYGNIYIVYNNDFKKHWEKDLRESYPVLKDSNGKDLYVKGSFARNDFSSPIYFWGEDDYIYYFPNGYSKTNVTAAKYSEKKVKNISYDGKCYITIEYVDGTKDQTINTELDYEDMVELNLNNLDSSYDSSSSNIDYNYKYNLIEYDLEKVEVTGDYNISLLDDAQNRTIRSEGKIISALGFSDCALNIRLFYLTVDKKLYYVDLVSDDSEVEVFVNHLVDTNVEKIGKRLDIEDSPCGTLDMIGYKKVGSSTEY